MTKSGDPQAELLRVLQMVRRGERTLARLAQAMQDHPGLFNLVPPAKFSSYLGEVRLAFEAWTARSLEQGLDLNEGPFDAGVVPLPRIVGVVRGEDRFTPLVFTSREIAEAYARKRRVCLPDEPAPALMRDWSVGVRGFLARDVGGILIDPGTEHRVDLNKTALSRLFAQLTLREVGEMARMHVVTGGGRVHMQKNPRGAIQIFVFDSPEAAEEGIGRLRARNSRVRVRAVETLVLLREAERAGVRQLIVNPMLSDERFYDHDDLEILQKVARGEAIPESTQEHGAVGTGQIRLGNTGVDLPVTGQHDEADSSPGTHIISEEELAALNLSSEHT